MSTRAMSDWTPKEKRAFAQGINHASARLGNALTPPLVAWLILAVTWRGSFIFLGILSPSSGLMNTGSALTAIVSPLVFGNVIHKTGDWTLPFLVSIGLLLIGAMPAFWMKPDEELPGATLTVTLAAKEAKL